MQPLLAITWLTWKAAFRFRLFLVIAVLLLASVVGLPLLLKDDGTAQGFTQIVLTYTLSVTTGLLGLSTLWLACGTLARDIEECQIQVVSTKPIARWQIWIGKWLGIVSLNAALLVLAGASVFGMLQWRASQLPAAQKSAVREQVLVARGSAREKNYDAEIDDATDKALQDRLKQVAVPAEEIPQVRAFIREQIKSSYQLVPGQGADRRWRIHLGEPAAYLKDRPLQLRVKFMGASPTPNGTYLAVWVVGDPTKRTPWVSEAMSLAPDTFHEFTIPANLMDPDGTLTIFYKNVNPGAVLFPLEDGMEVLYPESSFALNYARGVGIIFCWMALLAAIGLAAASFLSFPVAAFVSLAALAVALSTGTLANAVAEGGILARNTETGRMAHTPIDGIIIPAFQGVLYIINLARDFSPIDALSTGRNISWPELGRAFGQIVLLLGGIVMVFGIFVFNRRELATAQGNQ
jgi:hypothetical protein